MRIPALAAALLVAAGLAHAGDGFVRKTSPHSVPTTIDRLAAAVEAAGARIFARIDHAAGAASAGMALRPTTVLIFGNPKIGTPMMQAAQSMGLDLPMKVAAWQDGEGRTRLIYRDIRAVAAEHGATAPTTAKAAGALDKLTDKAIAAD